MSFELRFTDKEILAWAGMALMKRLLDHMQFGNQLAVVLCDSPADSASCVWVSGVQARVYEP